MSGQVLPVISRVSANRAHDRRIRIFDRLGQGETGHGADEAFIVRHPLTAFRAGMFLEVLALPMDMIESKENPIVQKKGWESSD
ncbi:hypothetical protein [Komagataeibacter swingsii]|uniref:Uncharacterized protein n=1 Tax=Komagataeibacter swingsii TaxID=215220 RepID=A0A2V4RM75_9PROT|nr:hypothetical protein [Komagataeibacter swingsii]PYD70961.1 hypothetical protein CFR76_03355 [Komagataeibacter swingsii]GBQ59882.1 hypothetical protein AA16373_1715 [Komagataeibacter swingsii DSM 16373]